MQVFNETKETLTWEALGDGGTGPRCYHTGVLYKGSIYYFGGSETQSGTGKNDFWKFDTRTLPFALLPSFTAHPILRVWGGGKNMRGDRMLITSKQGQHSGRR